MANDDEYRAVLGAGLSDYFGRFCQVNEISRRFYEYWSSFAIEEFELTLDGKYLSVIFKDLSPAALSPEARRTRPRFLYEPVREIQVYTRILAALHLGTAVCYGSRIDWESEQFWLFLEKVQGRELYQIGEFHIWQEVAIWLAHLHRAVPSVDAMAAADKLLIWDHDQFEECHRRALSSLNLKDISDPLLRKAIDRVDAGYSKAVEYLSALPRSFIHGEFYASNILIQATDRGTRICPIDWETAGIGPALIDLAALVAGRWTDDQRNALAMAYWSALQETDRAAWGSLSKFNTTLIYCRLHLAVLLLTRSPDWQPPAEHRHDWLKEAENLTDKLQQ